MRFALALLYYAVVAPLGLLDRLLRRGRDDLGIDRTAPSYWRKSADYVDLRSPR